MDDCITTKSPITRRQKFNQLGLHIAFQVAKKQKSNLFKKNFIFGVSGVMEILWVVYKLTTGSHKNNIKNRGLDEITSSMFLEHYCKDSTVALITKNHLSLEIETMIIYSLKGMVYKIPNISFYDLDEADSGCEDCSDYTVFQKCADGINNLFRKNTQSKIEELVDFNDIKEMNKLVDTNEIREIDQFYEKTLIISQSQSKGKWNYPFIHHTFIGTFYTSINSTCQVEMMTVNAPFLEINKMGPELQSIILRFRYNNNNALIICMPEKVATSTDLLAKIDYLMQSYRFETLLNSFIITDSFFQQIPKFSFKMHHNNLTNALQQIEDLSSLMWDDLPLPRLYKGINYRQKYMKYKNVASVTNFEYGTIDCNLIEETSTLNLAGIKQTKNYVCIDRPFIFMVTSESNHIIDVGIYANPPPPLSTSW